MFTASRALVLNTVLRESLRIENPAFGCLVAMPVRDLLLVHVMRDPTAAIALDLLVKIAASAHGAQAGPVSPHVYHVEGNTWQQVTDHSTGVVRVRTTGRLDDAMDRLGVDAGDRMSRWV